MKKIVLIAMAALFGGATVLASCGESVSSVASSNTGSVATATTSAQDAAAQVKLVINILDTAQFGALRDKGAAADTQLTTTVVDFPDAKISYALATDKTTDSYGNTLVNDASFVAISNNTLTIGKPVKYLTNFFVNVRATIEIGGQSFTHDFTVKIVPTMAIADLKAMYLEQNPKINSKNLLSASFVGVVASADYSDSYGNGYYYVVDKAGNGVYVYRGKPTDKTIKAGDSVRVTGQLVESGYGFEANSGAVLAKEGTAFDVAPKVLDEAGWNEEAKAYTNYGDWVTVDLTLDKDLTAIDTSGKGATVTGKIGSTAVNWYFASAATNVWKADYVKSIVDLGAKAGQTLTITAPVTFYKDSIQLGWALNASASLKA